MSTKQAKVVILVKHRVRCVDVTVFGQQSQ